MDANIGNGGVSSKWGMNEDGSTASSTGLRASAHHRFAQHDGLTLEIHFGLKPGMLQISKLFIQYC
ncbi:MAG: hypothetical protein Q8S39_08180 [Ignavibacteria bacterium]|nr:hypothetical protein [Ignavibacteria bacterium]